MRLAQVRRGAVAPQGVARAREERVELDQRVERRRHLGVVRSHEVGELGEDALHLARLFGLELADAVPRLDRRRRLHEQRPPRGRLVVDDAAHRAARLATDRNHVPAVPHRHRHVGDALMRLQPSHQALEQLHELAFRGAQLAAQTPQRRRCIVAHRAIGIDGALDRALGRRRHDEALDDRREHGARDLRMPLVDEGGSRQAGGAEERAAAQELLAGPDAADGAQPGECRRQGGDRLGRPRIVAGKERPHGRDARVLALDGAAIAGRRQRSHARSARLGARLLGHQRENARQLQDVERVRVHATHEGPIESVVALARARGND